MSYDSNTYLVALVLLAGVIIAIVMAVRSSHRKQESGKAKSVQPTPSPTSQYAAINALRASDKSDSFPIEITLFERAYASMMDRREFIGEHDPTGHYMKMFQLLLAQVESDMKTAGQLMSTYAPYAGDTKDGVREKLASAREHASKVSEIVEIIVAQESAIDDVDTSYVDDFLNAYGELKGRHS